jgi:hypothetical protein
MHITSEVTKEWYIFCETFADCMTNLDTRILGNRVYCVFWPSDHGIVSPNYWATGHSSVVVKALCYIPEGRGFETQ